MIPLRGCRLLGKSGKAGSSGKAISPTGTLQSKPRTFAAAPPVEHLGQPPGGQSKWVLNGSTGPNCLKIFQRWFAVPVQDSFLWLTCWLWVGDVGSIWRCLGVCHPCWYSQVKCRFFSTPISSQLSVHSTLQVGPFTAEAVCCANHRFAELPHFWSSILEKKRSKLKVAALLKQSLQSSLLGSMGCVCW